MADKTIAPVLSSESNLQVAPFGDLRTRPCPGVPTRMLPPVTSNVAFGAVVPMPTFVPALLNRIREIAEHEAIALRYLREGTDRGGKGETTADHLGSRSDEGIAGS